MRNALLMVIMALLISSCGGMKFHSLYRQLTRPVPPGLQIDIDYEGEDLYYKGQRDGCVTGLAAYGNDRYKAAYDYTQDQNLVREYDYYGGWKDAYWYCLWYVYHWSRGWQQ